MHTMKEDYIDPVRLILDLVIEHRSIISSYYSLFTLDIPLDQLTLKVISMCFALMKL
jgi:hypothetical protein